MTKSLKARIQQLTSALQRSQLPLTSRAQFEAACDSDLFAAIGDFGAAPGLLARIEAGAVTDADRAALARHHLCATDSLDDFLIELATLDAAV